mmetsp:Transcript_22888/g.50032  ORF Transcript_22888/g.50032 Transcript_22888/m.50032 type:complete len:253 (-) Transcript_22888:488-1246(-)
MQPRVFLRRNGCTEPGFLTRLPPSFEELLLLADERIFTGEPSLQAQRIFSSAGDEILACDFDCIENDDVLFVSYGEDWRLPVPQTALTIPIGGEAARQSRSGLAIHFFSMLFSGPLPHLRWACGMAILLGSCVLMRRMRARWVWLIQGTTPAASLMGLAWLVTSADRTAAIGWVAVPAGMYSSFWGSVCMTLFYAVLVFFDEAEVVFAFAAGLKVLLWLLGHVLIWQVQKATGGLEPGEPISPMGDWTIGWF